MASIGIIITQSGVPGTPGESREDLVVGSAVTLSNFSSLGITSYKWELVGKPYTSSVTLSSTSSSVVSFTPDIVGSYLVELTINNKLKQSVVAAILTSRHGIRIPASGEGEEIPGGSFKAITESIRTLESDSLSAAMIQGKSISLNEPDLNDLLRYNGEEWIPSGKVRSDDLGFRNTQNILVKIPLSSAIQANPYWEYNAEVGTTKPCWKTTSSGGELPILDFLWNSFPHGSVLKKVYVIASCENPSSNQLTIRVEKNGAIWSSDQITSFVDQFVSTTPHTVSSNTGVTLAVEENTEFTHGNSNDSVVTSEELKIRLTADGTNTFRVFSVYAHFQTLSVGLYNGPLVAEGGGGEGQEDGGSGGTLDNAYDFGGPGEGRLITVDAGAVELNVPDNSNNAGLTITQNDSTNDPHALVINNLAYGSSIDLVGTTRVITSTESGTSTAYANLDILVNQDGDLGYDSSLFLSSTSRSGSAEMNLYATAPLGYSEINIQADGIGGSYLNLISNEEITFNAGSSGTISFNGDTTSGQFPDNTLNARFTGFPNPNIIGSLNELNLHGRNENFDFVTTSFRDIVVGDAGRTLIYTGAGTCTYRLPLANNVKSGFWFIAYQMGTSTPILNIIRHTLDTITMGSTVGSSATSDVVGSYIKFISDGVSNWILTDGGGTWEMSSVRRHFDAWDKKSTSGNFVKFGASGDIEDSGVSSSVLTGYLKLDQTTPQTVTNGTPTIAQGLILGEDVSVGTPNTAGYLKLFSAGDNAFYSTFTAGTQITNADYILPTALPTVSGQALVSTTGGVMSWATTSSHNPVTLAQSALTGGLSLNDQEIGFRAATTSLDGYLKHVDWNTFNAKEPAQTKGSISETASSVLTISNGTGSTVGPNVTVQVKKASASQDGYLGKDNWTTFNSKEPAQTKGTISSNTSSVISISNGSNSTVGPNVAITINKASASSDGYLGKDNWATFNAKEPAQTKGSISETASSIFTITNGSNSTVGPNVTVQVKKASALQDGYLGKDDFVAFSSGGHNPVTLAQSAVTGGLSLAGQEISFRAADTNYDGYLKSADWDTFNSKEPSQTKGSISETGSSVLTVSNGIGSTVGPNVTVQVKKASASQDGYLGKDDFVAFSSGGHNPVTLSQSAITGGLSLNNQEISFRAVDTNYDGYLKSADWDTFNSKEPALSKGNLTETSSGILIFGGTTTNNVIGYGTTIQVKKASALQDGYLGKDDFATFAAGGGGGDGYWSRDLVGGYLRPITTTDTIMVGNGDSAHPSVEFGNTSSGIYYDSGNKKIIIGVDSVVKAYFDEDGLNFPGSESVSGCASASNTDVDVGTETVDNFIPTADGACVWHYFIGSGANIRGGTIMCAWDLSEEDVTYSEQSTASLGNTSTLVFSVVFSGGYINLNATATSNDWSVKVFRLRIQ